MTNYLDESFEVSGSISVVVEEEIKRPQAWEIMNEHGRRKHIVEQLNLDLPLDHDFVTEVLESAEELFDE